MKKLILTGVSVFMLGTVAVTGVAAEKAAPASAPARQSQTTPSNGARQVGRFVTDVFNLAGSALKWTGNAAKSVANGAGDAVTNLIGNLESQKKAKP